MPYLIINIYNVLNLFEKNNQSDGGVGSQSFLYPGLHLEFKVGNVRLTVVYKKNCNYNFLIILLSYQIKIVVFNEIFIFLCVN